MGFVQVLLATFVVALVAIGVITFAFIPGCTDKPGWAQFVWTAPSWMAPLIIAKLKYICGTYEEPKAPEATFATVSQSVDPVTVTTPAATAAAAAAAADPIPPAIKDPVPPTLPEPMKTEPAAAAASAAATEPMKTEPDAAAAAAAQAELWPTKFTKIDFDGGSPAADSNISCGRYTTNDAIANACLADSSCVGFSLRNAVPWCMKKTAGNTSLSDHTYYKKL